jgi:hypothetical protein
MGVRVTVGRVGVKKYIFHNFTEAPSEGGHGGAIPLCMEREREEGENVCFVCGVVCECSAFSFHLIILVDCL